MLQSLAGAVRVGTKAGAWALPHPLPAAAGAGEGLRSEKNVSFRPQNTHGPGFPAPPQPSLRRADESILGPKTICHPPFNPLSREDPLPLATPPPT